MPEAFISLEAGADEQKVAAAASAQIVETIGKIARPRKVHVVPDMPQTRSGKIMRRILAALAEGRDPGDTATLANPEVVEEIRKRLEQSAKDQ